MAQFRLIILDSAELGITKQNLAGLLVYLNFQNL